MQEPICFGVVGGSGLALTQPVTAANPLPVTAGSALPTYNGPTTSALGGQAPTVQGNTALAGTGVLKASAGNLYGVNVYSSAAGYLFLYDATTAPGDGATGASLKRVVQVAAGQAVDVEFPTPLRGAAGWSWVFSSTAPVAQTTSATAFVSAQVA